MVDEFRRRLDDARREILRAVVMTDEELAALEVHQAGGTTETGAVAVLSRLEGRGKRKLEAIDEARGRLAAGTYGICDGCRRPIQLARLRGLPTARYCVSCRDREEG